MPYRPSESRYSGGGRVKYLVYKSGQEGRGAGQRRSRVKRLYFPANASGIAVGKPGAQEKRTGTRVFGVAVRYEAPLARTRARRGSTRYETPRRSIARQKIIELPRGASDVRLSDRAPEGPRMDVR
jgi:hypothetical protein